MRGQVSAFIARRWNILPVHFQVVMHSLRGGLESAVARARISTRASPDSIPSQLVIKRLALGHEREVRVYETLWRYVDVPPTIRLLGHDRDGPTTYLFLEHAERSSNWPWSNIEDSAAVCRELARLHDCRVLPIEMFEWDYDRELSSSAAETLALAQDARDPTGKRYWRRLGDIERVVAALPYIRQQLLSRETTVVHGDVHPGNVILRKPDAKPRVVLIDWARARVGSPMEDVACWLHALGCWEPAARRRHDTLMRVYLQARGSPRVFSREERVVYWFASASNGLSGAIRYHLAVLSGPVETPSARYDSTRALTAWERVMRRVAALLRTEPRGAVDREGIR